VWNYYPNPNIAERASVPQTSPWAPPEKPIWPKGAAVPVFSNPMYDRLNTNIPKGLMQYSDQDFPVTSLLFPTREDVQEYLVKYSHGIRHLISFSTQVEDVTCLQDDGQGRWNLTARSTITGEISQSRYDAIVVANGHYSVPFIPSVPGIEPFNALYPSIISHSKIYRSPAGFENKKVVVVGNAASGLDIGTQISLVCKKPLLNSVRESSPLKLGQGNKEEVSPISEYLLEDRGVRFEDGRMEKDIDAVVYCTGYLYSYPFLKSLDPPIVTTGRRVIGLYQQLFSYEHPTLAFTALAQKIIPFPISEVQGAAIAKVWSDRLRLPEIEEMKAWEEKRMEQTGDGTSYHVLGYPYDADYMNYLHDWVKTAGFTKKPAYWGEKQKWVREVFAQIRKKFVETGGQANTMEELGFDFEKRHR
jgi:cation diffusion facilitator CzcD-associated flavoprotein CzcO